MTDQTDQTPVTDDDRKAREWADGHSLEVHGPWAPIARAIRAHVPAPPATLADELREAVSGLPVESKLKHQIGSLADRVEEMEERTRQAESYAGEYHQAIRERDEARAEVERLTAQVARQQQLLELNGVPRDTVVLPDAGSTPALPDPADVPAGEPWLVRDDQGLCLGLRCDPDDRKQPWCLLRVHNGTMRWRTDADVTLIRPVNISGLNPEETA